MWGLLAIPKRTGGGEVKLKGKRYTYNTFTEFGVAFQKFAKAGDTFNTSANPITGEYWLEVILKGEQVKKELPNA